MWGTKLTIDGESQYNWVNAPKEVVRLLASLTTLAVIQELGKWDDWEVLEDTDSKYSTRGRITGFQWSIELVRA